MDIVAELKKINLVLSSKAGSVKILNNINLNIMKGERVALIGPSGSGKSSLLMILAGLENPTSGKVSILNNDLGKLNEDQKAKFRGKNIGIIFQEFHLIPTMTALENVSLPLELMGEKNSIDKAKKIMNEVNLFHRLDHFPSQLSGGEQQRVAIARALIAKTNLILADEPTGNLDYKTSKEIFSYFLKLKKLKKTIIFATHNRELANRADYKLFISNGDIKRVNAR